MIITADMNDFQPEGLFDRVVSLVQAAHPQVQTGRFATDMKVHLVNDGPVTIPLRVT